SGIGAGAGNGSGIGAGLRGMRERIGAVGGTVVAEQREQGGFIVRAEVPLAEVPAAESPAGASA
ncbi:sensor histidine kinase, partial [Leucobacter soli]